MIDNSPTWLRGEHALHAALRFEGVALLLDGRPISNVGVLKLLRSEGLSANEVGLSCKVSREIYHRVQETPMHVHHGHPAAERTSWRGSIRATRDELARRGLL